MLIHITRLREDIQLPSYATHGSVAFDLAPAESVLVHAHDSILAPTGLIIRTPPGYALVIAPRSSLFRAKGLRLGNTVGIIDQDFCGPEDELCLFLWNPTDHEVTVQKGERIAQGMFVAILRADWEEAPAHTQSRGGWGSTGGYREG